MINLISIKLLTLLALIIRFDITILVNHLSLIYGDLLFSPYDFLRYSAGLLPVYIIIIQAIICLISAFMLLSISISIKFSAVSSCLLGIRWGIISDFGLFKPIRLFHFILCICYIGMVSGLFLSLSYGSQIYFIIIGLGCLVEIYDCKKFFLHAFIKNVLENKTYYISFAIFRAICYSLFINIIVIILIFLNILPLNYYILPLEISLINKLISSSILAEMFTLNFYLPAIHKGNSRGDGNKFSRDNSTVIMPVEKYRTLSLFDPEWNINKSSLWVHKGSRWKSYYYGSYHEGPLKVFGTRNLRTREFVTLDPLPKADVFYWRSCFGDFIPLDTSNCNYIVKPLYLKHNNG